MFISRKREARIKTKQRQIDMEHRLQGWCRFVFYFPALCDCSILASPSSLSMWHSALVSFNISIIPQQLFPQPVFSFSSYRTYFISPTQTLFDWSFFFSFRSPQNETLILNKPRFSFLSQECLMGYADDNVFLHRQSCPWMKLLYFREDRSADLSQRLRRCASEN